MNPLVQHIASGQAFFTGAVAIVAGTWLAEAVPKRTAAMAGRMLTAAGVLFVLASATPLPWWTYAVGIAAALACLALTAVRDRTPRRGRIAVLVAGTLLWTGAAIAEARWHLVPRIPAVAARRVDVIGDSVSAGTGARGEVTWPQLLARRHGVDVRDHSAVGATARSAWDQAAAIEDGPTLVFVEIGGNDLLGSTSVAEFDRDLDGLLSRATGTDRVVVMLELPLPPTFNAFGAVQRRRSVEHGAVLVPKRVFLGVLAEGGSTLDSIHLSESGHERMAETVWQLTGRSLPDASP